MSTGDEVMFVDADSIRRTEIACSPVDAAPDVQEMMRRARDFAKGSPSVKKLKGSTPPIRSAPRPVPEPLRAPLPGIPREPSLQEECPCGRTVTSTRGPAAHHFYCCDCGQSWSRPAPVIKAPRPPVVKKVCECGARCHKCGRTRR